MNIEPGKTARRLGKLLPNPNTRLREQFHEVARFKSFSERAEAAYGLARANSLRLRADA